eukprot:m.289759 g.289759  ORF g.289759 m.289759 type:complete len:455 (-) comp19461_c1_seq18:551-1915(-)
MVRWSVGVIRRHYTCQAAVILLVLCCYSISLSHLQFLIEIWRTSLLLPALYGATLAASTLFCGALVGDQIDKSPRLVAVRVSLFVQNTAVLVAVGILWFLLKHHEVRDGWFWTLFVLLLAFSVVSHLASLASTLAVEKDWVRVICGSNEVLLAKTNARLRRIDLSCKILAPMLVGFLMTYLGALAGAIFIGAWNLATWPLEYVLLSRVHSAFPALQATKTQQTRGPERTTLQLVFKQFIVLVEGWRLYSAQSTFRPGLALGFLYCTVLSFGSIMTGYTYYRGMSEVVLGSTRGVGAIFGIGATMASSRLIERFGLVPSGMIGVWAQLVCLLLSLLGVLYGDPSQGNCSQLADHAKRSSCEHNRNVELTLLLLGVVSSRMGLWTFDLVVSQLLQQRSPANQVGIISGVQASVHNTMNLLGFVIGIILHRPEQFHIQASSRKRPPKRIGSTARKVT